MKISKYLHSCVLVEDNGKRALIDPGTWAFVEGKVKPDDFKAIDLVVFTHKHQDHFEKSALQTIVANNPNVQIVSNSDTLDEIKELANTHLLEEGEQEIAGFKLKAFFAEHEDVGAPVPKNTAYILNDRFLHPGDSLKQVITEHKVDVLAVPVAGPWLTRLMAMQFAKDSQPKYIVPIHDAHIKDFYTQWDYSVWTQKMQEQGTQFKSLKEPGDSFEI